MLIGRYSDSVLYGLPKQMQTEIEVVQPVQNLLKLAFFSVYDVTELNLLENFIN